MALHYLTVQDVLTLNLRVTGAPQAFDYAKLEEAVFCQYAPVQSSDVFLQAGKFLWGFARLEPFSSGNRACAFVATVAFLEANGFTLDLADPQAAGWVAPLFEDRALAADWLRSKGVAGESEHEHGVPDVAAICDRVLDRFPLTVAALLQRTAAAS
jgi:prophage maintenance system killer protein